MTDHQFTERLPYSPTQMDRRRCVNCGEVGWVDDQTDEVIARSDTPCHTGGEPVTIERALVICVLVILVVWLATRLL